MGVVVNEQRFGTVRIYNLTNRDWSVRLPLIQVGDELAVLLDVWPSKKYQGHRWLEFKMQNGKRYIRRVHGWAHIGVVLPPVS